MLSGVTEDSLVERRPDPHVSRPRIVKGPVSGKKMLSTLVILSMDKTMIPNLIPN